MNNSEKRKINQPTFYGMSDEWGWNQLTDSVEELFEINNNGIRVIKVDDVKELRFELGGSPFTDYTCFWNGSFEVDFFYERLLKNDTDWNSEDCHPLDYVIEMGNQLYGSSLINLSPEVDSKEDGDEYMSEEYLRMLCHILWGDIPFHVWVEGELG